MLKFSPGDIVKEKYSTHDIEYIVKEGYQFLFWKWYKLKSKYTEYECKMNESRLVLHDKAAKLGSRIEFEGFQMNHTYYDFDGYLKTQQIVRSDNGLLSLRSDLARTKLIGTINSGRLVNNSWSVITGYWVETKSGSFFVQDSAIIACIPPRYKLR